MTGMRDDAFKVLGDAASDKIKGTIVDLLRPTIDEGGEATQAILLGSLAGAVAAWAYFINDTTTRARFVEAMVATAADFAGQAFDEARPMQ